jgi:hypothetical protein
LVLRHRVRTIHDPQPLRLSLRRGLD